MPKSKFADIVSFNFEKFNQYGFSSVQVIGKDIHIYSPTDRITKKPAISKSDNPEELKRTARFFDLLYLTTYETDVAFLAAAHDKEKPVLIALSDIFEKEGLQRAVTINRISRFIKFCKSYKVAIRVATLAKNEINVRTPEEIVAICSLVDPDNKETLKSIRPNV